jgi:hypothetical protein
MVIKGIPVHVWKKLPVDIWYEIYLHVIYNEYWTRKSLTFRSLPLEYFWNLSAFKTERRMSLYYKDIEIDRIDFF